jgi:LysR family glycine cleavage system transcriptional activator
VSTAPPRRRLPPLNALRAFEAAGRHLSFARAAEELSVSPGAISQQIRVLEQHAGGALFRRDGRQTHLTDLGNRLYPLLREGFDQLQRASDLIYRPIRRSLAVSVPPSFAARWLTTRLVRFAALHPEIEVWISADMQLSDVAGGRVDVAVRYGLGNYPDVRSDRLLDADVLPVCSPALLAGPDPLRRPKDLARHILIHVQPAGLEEPRPSWVQWLGERGLDAIDAEAGPRFDQTALALETAIHGRGVALAPRAFVAADLAAGRLVAPFADGLLAAESAYHVLIRKGAASEEARQFRQWLLDEAAAPDDLVDEL